MKKGVTATIAMICMAMFAANGFADTRKGERINGKKEFEKHCAACHANGGNIVNPAKPLHKKEREANGIRTWKDIIAKMRNPGPGMTKFEKKDVPDKEAKAIAAYILKTFK